jgi:dipeptidyl-peptidase-3
MANHINLEARVQNLHYLDAWQHLNDREKNYAYFISKACWAGAKMVPHQVCYESPPMFVLFQAYFAKADFFILEKAAIGAGVSSEEWSHFIAYVGAFYGNLGPYHAFGHKKFVPQLTPEKFRTILWSHPDM